MGAGIVCICIGIVILLFNFKPNKIKNAVYTKGEVCSQEYYYIPGDKQNLYYISVRYFINGTEYYAQSKFRQSYIKDGKKILLKYNKENPKECLLIPKGSILVALIFILFGLYAILSTLEIISSFMH